MLRESIKLPAPFAAPNEGGNFAFHQDFRRERHGVVPVGHDHPVGSGRVHRQQIAAARCSAEGKKGLEAFFTKVPPAWAARVALLRKTTKT